MKFRNERNERNCKTKENVRANSFLRIKTQEKYENVNKTEIFFFHNTDFT